MGKRVLSSDYYRFLQKQKIKVARDLLLPWLMKGEIVV